MFIALLVPLGAAFGQSQVSELPTVVSDTAIVRYWKNDVSIVYTCNNSTKDKYFMLVDKTLPVVRRIAVPQNITVNDFRIYDQTVYFGGHHVDGAGMQRGLLACFDINDFSVGSGNYHWMVTLQTPMPDCYCGCCQNQIYDITRIAVFDTVPGNLEIAYIGKNYITGETTMRVGIGCASYNSGIGSWSNSIIYNKHAKEEYSDIIATQNYVVAVARHNVFAQLVMRVFPKTDFIFHVWGSGGSCPAVYWSYYPNTNGQKFTDLTVDESVMATALDGDNFAVAYHYIASSNDGLAVKTFGIAGSVASLQQGLNVSVPHRSNWKMRDIRYSPQRNQLLVLNDFDGGTLGSQESVVYQFPVSSLVTGTYYGRYLPSRDLYAMDIYGATSDALVATGNPNGGGLPFIYWENIIVSQSCGSQDVVMGKEAAASWEYISMSTNINDPNPYNGDSLFVVEVVPLETICSK